MCEAAPCARTVSADLMPSPAALEPAGAPAGMPVVSGATATVLPVLDGPGLRTRVPGAGRLPGGDVRP